MLACVVKIFRDWGGHIMSLLCMIGGLWVYFSHDRKLKKQNEILNDLEISKLQEENTEKKKAKLKPHFYHLSSSSRKFVLKNRGDGSAHNVRIEILNNPEEQRAFGCTKAWGPYESIEPDTCIEERIKVTADSPDYFNLRIVWDDEDRKDKERFLKLKVD